MSNISSEIIYQIALSIGNIYQNVTDAIGTPQSPNSFNFDMAQLGQLGTNNLPQFGILGTTVPGFEVIPSSSDSRFATVSQGQVAYNGVSYSIPTQDVSIFRTFGSSYDSTYRYGVVIGLPLSEILKSITLSSTSVNANTLATATMLPVADTSIATNLGFPLKAQVGSVTLIFIGVDITGQYLIVDPTFGNGTVQIAHPAGENVYFIYEPHVRSICGLPVGASFLPSNTSDASSFTYYPPMPKSWLPIANCLVEFVGGSVQLPSPTSDSIFRTVQEWPGASSSTPIFSSSDSQRMVQVSKVAQSSMNSLLSSIDVSNLLQGLINYTSSISNSTSLSFNQFWALCPFQPTSNFLLGVSFDNMQRMDFPDTFKAAYYNTYNQDLQRTFAIFRGDLYNSSNPYIGVSIPSASMSLQRAIGTPSLLGWGNYVYGVTCVTDRGETAPIIVSNQTTSYEFTGAFMSLVSWLAATGTSVTILSYHVYRLATLYGDQQYFRLTQDGEITSPPIAALTFVPSTTNYAQLDSVSEAIMITTSTAGYMGGIEVQLRIDGTTTPINLAATITFELWTDNAGVPDTLIATGDSIAYSSLTSNYQYIITPLTYETLGYTLSASTNYWIILQHSDIPPGSGHRGINLLADYTGTGLYATFNGTNWTAVNTIKPYFNCLGFVDDGTRTSQSIARYGIKLTGATALAPAQLRVYVPPMTTVTSNGLIPGNTNDTTNNTQNELIVTVVAQLGETGTPKTFIIDVPQYTPRDTSFPISTNPADVFDRVIDVQVVPGNNVTTGYGGNGVQWSVNDLITVETIP